MRRRAWLLGVLAWCSSCGVGDDEPAALTIPDSETEPSGYTVDCGNRALGCVQVEWYWNDAECTIECTLPQPCPTSEAWGWSEATLVAEPACLVDTLRTMSGPLQLVHGEVSIDDGPSPPTEPAAWDTQQWHLWLLDGDQVVLRRVDDSCELSVYDRSTQVVGGTLPAREAFDACAALPSEEMWACALAAIEWCDEGIVAGPSGDQPWC